MAIWFNGFVQYWLFCVVISFLFHPKWRFKCWNLIIDYEQRHKLNHHIEYGMHMYISEQMYFLCYRLSYLSAYPKNMRPLQQFSGCIAHRIPDFHVGFFLFSILKSQFVMKRTVSPSFKFADYYLYIQPFGYKYVDFVCILWWLRFIFKLLLTNCV